MKHLMLMRHAKSSWKNAKLPDKERPLTKRGEKDVPKMVELLEDRNLLPQVILTSTALRCRQTANAILDHCTDEITFRAVEALYMAEPAGIIEVLKTVDDAAGGSAQRVMVIGHNPGLEGLLQGLSGAVESLPTASIACIELPIEHWADISLDTQPEKWEKWRPKDAAH